MDVDFWEGRWSECHTPWDHGEPAPPVVDFLRTHPIKGRVLIPGCGSGYEVRLIAAQNPGLTLGLDLAPSAIAHARSLSSSLSGSFRETMLLVDHELVEGRRPAPLRQPEYRVADFLHLPFEFAGRFDWVVEHTLFCALFPRQRPQYVDAVARALKPGGRYLAVFYRNPPIDGERPYGINPDQLDSLFARHFRLLDAWEPLRAFPSRLGREQVRLYTRR